VWRQRTAVSNQSERASRSAAPLWLPPLVVLVMTWASLAATMSLLISSECLAVWFPETRLTDASGKSWLSHNNGRSIATGPDGLTHIVWNDSRSGRQDIYYKSFDGLGWTTDENVTGDLGGRGGAALTVDGGGKTHIVWHDGRDGEFEIYYKLRDLDRWGPDERLTVSDGKSYNPSLAVDGMDNLHLVWHDNRDGNFEIYYKRYDGESWGPDERLTNDPTESSFASVAVDRTGKVHVVWHDELDGQPGVYHKCFDGTSWTAAWRLHSASSSGRDASIVSGSDSTVHVVWVDGSSEIYYKRHDGDSWQSEIRLTSDDGTSGSPGVAVDDSHHVHVAWEDLRSGYWEIYYKVCREDAWSEDRRVAACVEESRRPAIAVGQGGSIHIVWRDLLHDNHEIFWRKWHSAPLSRPEIVSIEPTVWHSGEYLRNAHVRGTGFVYPDSVWMTKPDEPRLAARNLEIHSGDSMTFDVEMDCVGLGLWDVVVKNPDGQEDTLKAAFEVLPARLWGDDVRLTHAEGMSMVGPNRTIARGPDGKLHLVWADFRSGVAEIYYSLFDGEWQAEQSLTASGTDSYAPAIAIDGDGNIHVVWHENRDGDVQIYYKHFDGLAWEDDIGLTIAPSLSREASVATDPLGDVHVVWSDQRDGDREIYYKKFGQGSWSRDKRLTVSQGLSRGPVIDSDPEGRIHVAWIDARDGNGEIYYKMHNGSSWEADERITDVPGTPESVMLTVGSDCSVRLVWSDDRDDIYRIYYRMKDGDGWRPTENLSDHGYEGAYGPFITLDVTDGAYVLFEARPCCPSGPFSPEIYCMRDHGGEWSDPERVVESDGVARRPSAVVDAAGTLHLVWNDDRDGNFEVYYSNWNQIAAAPIVTAVLPPETTNMSTMEAVITGDHFLRDPRVWLSMPGEDLLFAEYIERPSPGNVRCDFRLVGVSAGEWDIHVKNIDQQTAILPAGLHISDTPWGGERLLTSSQGHSATATNNARCVAWDSEGNVHVVWHDERGGDYEIYYRKGNGRVWGGEVRLTDNGGHSRSPSVAVGKNGTLHVCWNDDRDGNWEVFYKQFEGGVWRADTRLSRGDGVNSAFPCMTVDFRGNPFVFCQDQCEGAAILCSRWDGSRWLEEMIATGAGPRRPTAASDTLGNTYVIWEMGGYNGPNLYYRRWVDSTWYYYRELLYSKNELTAPTCACDPAGRLMVVCREDRTTWGLRSVLYDGRDWVDIGEISPGGSEPNLCADGQGIFHLMTTCAAGKCRYSVNYQQFDRVWSDVQELNRPRTATQSFIAADLAGNLAVVWEDTRYGDAEIYWRYYDNPADTTEIVIPKRFGIQGIVPNPVVNDTEVRFALTSRSQVGFAIYDVTGRLVHKEDLGRKDPGFHSCYWDCLNSSGRKVSPGIYLARLKVSDNKASAKIIVLR